MKAWQTIVVDPAGVAIAKDLRALHEGARIEGVRSMGHVPPEVGGDVPQAPARGAVRMFEGRAMVPTDTGGFRRVRTGHEGRKTLIRADAFDVMAAKAARHRKASPFNPSQVAMGRYYRDLVEKHACAGVKCSSVEGLRSGGTGGDFMDAVLRDRQRIEVLRQRIGSGAAMVVRRQRPSSRGSRVSILDRRLVDMVCVEDATISDVLRAHGWANDAKLIKALQQGLGEILDRMMGPVRRSGVSAVQFGAGCMPVWD